MKIHIQLEVAPDEVPLATELLAVLRGLTDHVTLRDATPGSSSISPAASLPHALAGQASGPPPTTQQAPLPVQPAPAAPASAPPPQLAALPPLLPPAVPAPPAAPAAPPAAAAVPPGSPAVQMYENILLAAEHEQHPEQLARQLESIFLTPSLGAPLDQVREFAAVWKRITLDPKLLAQDRSAVPFVTLIAQLNKELQQKLRDLIVSDVLKHLTIKRPINADRTDFFVQAEAFAAMVSLGIVAMEGAVSTMVNAMMKKPENRAAAVTMLGKTVDLAHHLLLEKVKPETLQAMRAQVLALQESEFEYDKAFILESMGWAAPPAAADGHAVPAAGPAAAPAPPTPAQGAVANGAPLALRPLRSCKGHGDLVFGLAVDARHRQVVSGGKDPYLQVWTDEGQQLQRLELGERYVSTMDYHIRLGLLLCTGLTSPANQPTWLAAFAASEQQQGFSPQGFITRPPTSQVSCIRALPDTTGFITAEHNHHLGSQDILYWDVGSGTAFSSLQPVQTFRGHTDIVTTLARCPLDPSMFVSGSKDSTLLLWDMRVGQSVAQLGLPQPDGSRKAHAQMITCLDAAGHLLFSGGTDKTVKLWDLRSLSTANGSAPLASLDASGQVVLKVAANSRARLAVVATMAGLMVLDFANEGAPGLRRAEFSWPDGHVPSAYHDIKWHEDRGLLYGGGKDMSLDIYQLA